jgi:hypothetical protein
MTNSILTRKHGMSKKWHVVSNSTRFKDQVKSFQFSSTQSQNKSSLRPKRNKKITTYHSNSVTTHIKMPSSTEGSTTYITVDVSDAGKPIPGQGHAPANRTFPVIDRSDPNPSAPRPSNVVIVDVSDAGKPVSP